MRKNKTILFLVIAIAILFVCPLSICAANNVITQAEEGYYVKEFSGDDFATYRGANGYTEPRLGKADVSEHDYLFAGWYKDSGCNSPYTPSAQTAVDNVAYAKFVSADVMQVKCMVTEGTTEGSDTTNLRMISTVDSRFYSEMGFDVSLAGGATIHCVEDTGYARITDTVGGLQVGYSPIAFHNNAKYFFTHSITGITKAYFDDFFTVQPYWVTTDGTTVQGVARCLKVSDSYNKVLNLPIHLDSDRIVSEETSFTISYISNQFSYMEDSVASDMFGNNAVHYVDDGAGTITITVTPSSNIKSDGMLGNLRLKLNNGVLESTTTFAVGENDLNISDLAYKNYPSSYVEGSWDISWYEGFTENTEFVVSSVADLQGLARLVNGTTGKEEYPNPITFEGKKIILGADIIGYSTSVISEGIIVDGTEHTPMIPIGTYKSSTSYAFNGTFDGGNNTISGLYIKQSGYCGLFGECGKKSLIKNLKIANSYFTNDKNMTAAIAGRTMGNVQNICIDDSVVIHGTGYVGGIVGSYEANTDRVSVKDCAFYGTITANSRVGGIVGSMNKGPKTIEDCFVAGIINYEVSDKTSVGGIVGYIEQFSTANPGVYTIKNSVSCVNMTKTGDNVGIVLGGTGTRNNNTTGYGIPSVKIEDVYYTTSADLEGCGTNSVKATTADVTGAPGKLNVALTGVNAYKYTGLDFTSNNSAWVVVEGAYPQLKSFAEGTVISDLSGYQRADKGWYYNSFEYDADGKQTIDTFTIATVEDMFGLADLVNTDSNDFCDQESQKPQTVRMSNDIVFNNVTGGEAALWATGENLPTISWMPIGDSDTPFAGIFDGEGHTIQGLYMKGENQDYVGLFAFTTGTSCIQDLRLINSYLYSGTNKAKTGRRVGSFVAQTTGTTLSGLYSDAILVMDGTAGSCYSGGIVGYSEVADSSSVVIENCWFTGDIDAYRFAGGIIGAVNEGTTTLQNCLYDGTITCSYSENVTGNVYAGGICGIAFKTETPTVLNVDSCISVGNIYDSNKENGVGMITGVVQGNETKTSKLIVNNVFAARDSVSLGAKVESNGSMEGVVTWINQKDRLMGYCTQATVDGVTPSLSSEDWTMRLSGAPIPARLSNVLAESDIVSTDTLDAELGLNTTGIDLNLSSALNTGLGNYTLTKQGVEADAVTAYRNALVDSLDFEELYKNGVVENEGVVTYDVYNGSFVKDEGNWLLQVIYSASNKVLNITISTEGRSALSTRLSSDSTQVSEENTNPVKLAMLSLTGSVEERTSLTYYYGNSFVFTLPQDGHYIICDGGNKGDLTGLLEYVRRNPAADGNVYIDAWVVSHQHGDHFSVIENVYSKPTLIDGVYVEAFYMNEPNATTYAADTANMDLKSHNQRMAMAMFKTAPEGETSKIYRMSTGQKYYFDGLSMDVVLTHDVMNLNLNSTEKHDVSTVNRSSAIVLFTTDSGEKIFIGGDADYVNMKYIVAMYGQDDAGYTSSTLLQGIDVFVALHHGKNSSYASNSVAGDNTFVNYLTTDTSKFTYVLYPCSFEYGVEATLTDEYFQNVGTVNQHLNTRTQYHYDFGDGHVIIDLSTMGVTVESTTAE